MDLKPFQFCLFYQQGGMTCGWIERIEKNKAVIQTPDGQSLRLPAGRILYRWEDAQAHSNPTTTMFDHIAETMARAAETAKGIDLEQLYEQTEAHLSYTLEELAARVAGLTGAQQHLGLLLALHDPVQKWFKRHQQNQYIPRTREEYVAWTERKREEAEQQLWQERTAEWVKELERGDWRGDTLSDAQKEWLHRLTGMLTLGRHSEHWKVLGPALGLGGALGEEEIIRLRDILAAGGRPVSWCRMQLLKAGVREFFTGETLAAAEHIAAQPLPDRPIWDEAPIFTVDSSKTEDFDDAISVTDWSESGVRVAVHITDLSYAIQPENPLFNLALEGVSSVYTLARVYPMLPPLLANDYFSLKVGACRCVLTFIFRLQPNGGWSFETVLPRVVKIAENLSYGEADKRVQEGVDFWPMLEKCCMAIYASRLEHGAQEIDRKELIIDIADPDHIQVSQRPRNTSSSRIVQELAILVNREVGRMFKERDYPGLYRTQAPPEQRSGRSRGGRGYLPTPRFEPVRLTTEPGGHAGLACDYYIQSTSPIRRFADLAAQLQLSRCLEDKEPLFSAADLEEWIETIESKRKDYAQAEEQIRFHWKTRYLAQNIGRVFDAVVRRRHHPQVSDVTIKALQYNLQINEMPPYPEGSHFYLKIQKVDPRRHEVDAVPWETSR